MLLTDTARPRPFDALRNLIPQAAGIARQQIPGLGQAPAVPPAPAQQAIPGLGQAPVAPRGDARNRGAAAARIRHAHDQARRQGIHDRAGASVRELMADLEQRRQAREGAQAGRANQIRDIDEMLRRMRAARGAPPRLARR
jgi:hypothetical protein